MADILQKIQKQILKVDIMLVGQKGVGKSSIFIRYFQNKFIQTLAMTTGCDFMQKKLLHKDKTVRLVIWDTAGHEAYRVAFINRFKYNNTIIFVYDMSNTQSMEELLKYWIPTAYDECNPDCLFIVFGNKSDRVENPQQIKNLMDGKLDTKLEEFNKNYMSFYGNCKEEENTGISDMIAAIIETLYKQKMETEEKQRQNKELEIKRSQLIKPEYRKTITLHQNYKKKSEEQEEKKSGCPCTIF